MYLYLRNKNVFNLCFSTTQWTFLFETAAKHAMKYVKQCRTESVQKNKFLWDQVGNVLYK